MAAAPNHALVHRPISACGYLDPIDTEGPIVSCRTQNQVPVDGCAGPHCTAQMQLPVVSEVLLSGRTLHVGLPSASRCLAHVRTSLSRCFPQKTRRPLLSLTPLFDLFVRARHLGLPYRTRSDPEAKLPTRTLLGHTADPERRKAGCTSLSARASTRQGSIIAQAPRPHWLASALSSTTQCQL